MRDERALSHSCIFNCQITHRNVFAQWPLQTFRVEWYKFETITKSPNKNTELNKLFNGVLTNGLWLYDRRSLT